MEILTSFPRRAGNLQPCGGAGTARSHNRSAGFIRSAEFGSGGALFKAPSSSSARRRGGTTALQHLPRRRAGADPRASSPGPAVPRTARPAPSRPIPLPAAPGGPTPRAALGASARRPPFPPPLRAAPAPRSAGRRAPAARRVPPVPSPAALPQRARAFVPQPIPAGGGSASSTAGRAGRGAAHYLAGRDTWAPPPAPARPPWITVWQRWGLARRPSPAAPRPSWNRGRLPSPLHRSQPGRGAAAPPVSPAPGAVHCCPRPCRTCSAGRSIHPRGRGHGGGTRGVCAGKMNIPPTPPKQATTTTKPWVGSEILRH